LPTGVGRAVRAAVPGLAMLIDSYVCPAGRSPRERACRNSEAVATDLDVLVVDDDEDVRTSLAEILGNEGLTVGTAHNGREALRVLRSANVGLLLLDLNMPVLSGYAVVDELETPPPIIVLTGQERDEEIDRRSAKLTGFLQKPCEPHRLLAVVTSCLRGEAISDTWKA
jgi:DNA-binding response OmpR family regulator